MNEAPDVNVKQSDKYREIYVTGQIMSTTYEGLRATVINDVPNIENAVGGHTFKQSKLAIDKSSCIIDVKYDLKFIL